MRNLVVILFIFLTTSCTDIQTAEKPDDFYGDQKMADILTDLYLIDGSMSNNRSAFTKLKTLPTDYIYDKYNTDSVTYRENFLYYADRVEEYQQVLEIVEQNLEVVKDSVEARQQRVNKRITTPAEPTEIIKDPDNQ
ncbi:DUF4296 domain-containing protein [Nonlabens ponticola]|uniref:DUF4296 domain-containing protein n=1 Tax=Nonlabens ponticola TaxID=2496866 RepID=A0A3S9MUP0_9FLAO|nr:DUF4296 domain-containing protein [Nonlabens ponticola]AZQ42892.1 DUF4296 domain-containing protein [Nonlabens ponticola]